LPPRREERAERRRRRRLRMRRRTKIAVETRLREALMNDITLKKEW